MFKSCTGLTKVQLDCSIKSTSASMFEGCTALTDATLPSNLQIISSYTFCGCKSLSQITIPENVYTIANIAFSGCSALTDVYVLATTPPSIITSYGGSYNSFPNFNITIHVPANALSSYQNDAD